jgi:hypothetical protein
MLQLPKQKHKTKNIYSSICQGQKENTRLERRKMTTIMDETWRER